MSVKETIQKINMRSALIIGLCFLLNSTGYLAWVYNLMTIVAPKMADGISMSAGYLAQAAGIFMFSLFLHYKEDLADRSLYFALFINMLCLVPAALSKAFMPVLLFGLLLNLCCGWIAGYYLYKLTISARQISTATTLGIGYGASIIVSWLISLIGDGSVYYSNGIFVICLILSAATIIAVKMDPSASGRKAIELQANDQNISDQNASSLYENDQKINGEKGIGEKINSQKAGELKATDQKVNELKRINHKTDNEKNSRLLMRFPNGPAFRRILLLTGGLILIFSIVNSCGFSFPSAHIQNGISVEFSRLFYAAGLIVAGFLNDRNRRYGAICALAALVVPFIMLALKGEQVPLMVFWALSYFTFGFYSVYRMILFTDIASAKKMIWLSGAGLMAGRSGDAAGEALNLIMSEHVAVLIVITAVLFFAAVFLFFRVDRLLYQPENRREKSEKEIFDLFSARHDLSAREREVLRLLLVEKTNAEMAEELFVSESTVKFHVHNILQKTGCKNRVALISFYSESRNS